MTQKEFDLLPGLLTAQQFRAVTGLQRSIIDQLRYDGELKTFTPPPPKSPQKRKKWNVKRRNGRFYKSDAARMSGFVM